MSDREEAEPNPNGPLSFCKTKMKPQVFQPELVNRSKALVLRKSYYAASHIIINVLKKSKGGCILRRFRKIKPSSVFAGAIVIFVVLMVFWAGYSVLCEKNQDSGGVALYINSNIVAENAQGQANLFIRNSKSNIEPWRVTIRANDTNECVYESDKIFPGGKVDYANLQSALAPGVHACTAEFHILTPDGNEKSTIRVGIKITVLT